MPQDDPFLTEARRQAQGGGADDPFLAEARRQAGPEALPRAAPIQAGPPRPRLTPEQEAEHRRRLSFGEGPTRLRQAVGAALEAGAVALGGPGAASLLTTLHPEEARGAGKAVVEDLPSGLAHFVTAPVRAVTAPPSVEEARHPLVRGAQMARSGTYLDLESGVRAALARQGDDDSPTPGRVMGEALRGMVTMGYDAERAAIEAEGPEEKARAIANLALLGGLTAVDAGAKRLSQRRRSADAARTAEQARRDEAARAMPGRQPADPLDEATFIRRARAQGGTPPAPTARPQVELPTGILRMRTSDIIADPARFQFKELGTEGVSGELKGVQKFNEQLAGVVSVWRDPADGQVYVVNGHHRLELARRLGQPELNVQFITAPDAPMARAEGAFMNIAEGRGTATDVAKFLRDMQASPGDLEARGVSVRGDLARDGMALSRLAPDVFDQVATAQIPQAWGVAIGQLLDDAVLQRETLAAVRGSGKRLSAAEVTEVARQVRDAGTEAVNQETLFGSEAERRGVFVQRAQLAAAIKKRLMGDKRLFGFVTKEGRAQELSRAGGTQIDVAAASSLAEASARTQEIFDRLYTRSGPLADILTEGARRIARGERAGSVAADIYPAIGDAVAREIEGGLGPGARPDGGERPVPAGTRSLADEIAAADDAGAGEASRVADSQDPAQAGMFMPAGRGGGRSYNATDLRASLEAAVRSAKQAERPLFLYKTARGWRMVDRRPPTTDVFYRVEPDGHVVKSEPVFEGEGGRRETEVSTGDVPVRAPQPSRVALAPPPGRTTLPSDPAVDLTMLANEELRHLRELAQRVVDRVPETDMLSRRMRADVEALTAELERRVRTKVEGHARPPRGDDESARPRPALRLTEEGPEQGSMFSERAGTAASRSLAETERAARGELDVLRQRLAGTTDPARRTALAAQIAERERLLNRERGISAEELQTRATAEGAPATPTGPDQLAFFSPAATPEYTSKLRALGTAPDADVLTQMEISRKLAEAVGVPLRQGRFGQRALGVFFPRTEVTRVQRFDMIGTAAHEVAHYISKKYLRNPTMRGGKARAAAAGLPPLPREAAREAVQLGRDLYGPRKPTGGYGEEGLAEWGKFYVTDPAHLVDAAPHLAAWMDAVLAREPLLKAALDQARERFVTHQQAPATARVDAMISVGEREALSVSTREYMRLVADDTYDVRAAVQELGGAANPARDAGVLARLARGTWGEAAEWLERGVRKAGSADDRMGSGIVPTFEPLIRAGRAQELRRYLDAESALERWRHGINPGISRADAQAMVELYGQDPLIRAAAEAAWTHSRALLRARLDAGLLTQDQFAKIAAANERRVGFYRVFEPDEATVSRGGARGSLGSAGLKRQKGSARRIVDPIEAIIRDTYVTARKLRQEQATRALIDLADQTEGSGRILEEVPTPQRPVGILFDKVQSQLAELGLAKEITNTKTGQREYIPLGGVQGFEGIVLRAFEDARVAGAAEAKDLVVPVLKGGELRWYQIKDKPLYDALVGLGPVELDIWRRTLSFPKRLLQIGATTTLEFGFGNLARDIVGQSVFSKAGWRPPLWRHLEGIWHMLRRDPVYQRFRLHGGDQATMGGLDRGNVQLTARRLFGYFRTARQAWLDHRVALSRAGVLEKARLLAADAGHMVLAPLEAIRFLKDGLESAGRVGEFAAVERQALRRGAQPEAAATEAALAGRDVGIDFAQLGSVTREVNHGIAFFGAFMRGWAQLGRELKQRPHVVIPRLAAEVTVPSLALYYLQRDDPVYRDLPAWKRDLFWVYVQRGDDHGEGWDGYGSGKVERIWMFPKPFELGVLFGTLPERAAEWADGRNPEPGRAVAEALRRSVTPPHWPAVVQPLVENFANRSAFRDRPIVPRSREALTPPEQVTPYTGETARLLGRALNYAPAKIENLVRGYTGGAGMYVLKGADALVRQGRELTGAPPLKPPTTTDPTADPLAELPGLRRFVSRMPAEDAESVSRLYRQYEQAEAHRRTWRRMLSEGRAGEAREYFATHRARITSVATREETTGAPGPLRAAYEVMQELQELRRQLQAAGTNPEARRRLMEVGRRLAATLTEAP